MRQSARNIAVSAFAAWQSLRLSLTRLRDQERRAWREHFQAARERAIVAAHAGDPTTLIRDQLELAPASRERVRSNAVAVRRIVAELLVEWWMIWRALRQDLSK